MGKKLSIIKNSYKLFWIFILGVALIQNIIIPNAKAASNSTFGLETTASHAGLVTNTTLQAKVGQIVGSVLALIGVLFFVLMIYGGITWMTAGGNETTVTNAKKTITAAVIGLVIVISAYAITLFLGEGLAG